MRKLFTLLTLLALTCAGTLQAQTLKKSGAPQTFQQQTRRAVIEAGDNQLWWGYMGDADSYNSIGIGVADTYHCAMFLPGNHDVAGGKTLRALRFALTAAHASDVKVWTASSLPAGEPTAGNTLWVADVPASELGDWTDVALATPYEIPSTGVYVGYSFTITAASTDDDKYPVLTAGADQEKGFLIRTSKNMTTWSDLYGEGFGVLAMKVLLEGEFAQYVVSPAAAQSSYYAQVGESVDVDITLANSGQAAVSSIGYTISSDGETSAEQTVTLGSPIAAFKKGVATITVPASATASASKKTLTVTKVNGEANTSGNASATFTVYTLDRLIQRNVVVEEFTGTGCGYCPRGLVGMEKLRQTFGDRFVGIGIHQFNSGDAMYIANYASLPWTGAPSCMVDRAAIIDPYYGSNGDICDDFRAEMNQPAMVSVDVDGVINEAATEVAVTARVEPLFDTSDYRLELVLIADGLSGSTTAWNQLNNYASQASSSAPQDLRVFCSGGKYGQSSVKGYVFNDVALAWAGGSQVEALGSMTGGAPRQVSQTLNMPTKATLRTAVAKGTVYAVALVINSDGTIANAAKKQVADATGVSTARAGSPAPAASYSLDGMRLSAPQPGVNIVRMTDGTVRKVLVR